MTVPTEAAGDVRPPGERPASVLDELELRGLVAQTTGADALATALAGDPITYYCGFDPTAPSLHIGNLVQLLTMRRLQLAGHLPLALVGGATGLIGDPRMSGERVLNTPETVAGWVDRIRAQVQRYLDFEGRYAARMVNNLDWTAPMSAIDFLRDVGKHFRMGRMLAKETVSARLSSADGLSFTEFSYQILQGMDYLELYRRHGCTLQTGGNDQWGNLTSGTELIHKVEPQAAVHAMTTPLITKADGTKFGKTESGTVWLDAELTSPYAFYQFWVNTDDRDVGRYLRVFSFRSLEELAALDAATADRPQAREAQRALATEMTELVHGAGAATAAVEASAALFGRGDLGAVDAATLGAALREAGAVTVPAAEFGDEGRTVLQLLRDAGLAGSQSEARRIVAEGGANVNNERISDPERRVRIADSLHGRYLVLRRGRRMVAGVLVGER
ncbi:tyrosine--tRNA ligase [Nakamurella sp. YIM 132084]|uniref:Tyrosine--tRNA ligase n=1 Tax=Nakamurella leprariae TaxID=2803911 RepID=A0A938YHA4_9ACTN|nr:tyrosine--tRNA ligase [Nakamurella leprariae]